MEKIYDVTALGEMLIRLCSEWGKVSREISCLKPARVVRRVMCLQC